MSSLESRHFVASLADIETIATRIMQAAQAAGDGRSTYLKAFVATTQSALDGPRRARGASEKLPAAEVSVQLDAIERVDAKFYPVIKRAAEKALGTKNALEVNRRTTFARSSKSALKAWITAGNDVRSLTPSRVTKSSLAVAVPAGRRRVASSKVLANRARKAAAGWDKALHALAARDKAEARAALEAAMVRLSAVLAELSRTTPAREISKTARKFFPGPTPRQTRAAA